MSPKRNNMDLFKKQPIYSENNQIINRDKTTAETNSHENFPYIKIALASAAFLAISAGVLYFTNKIEQKDRNKDRFQGKKFADIVPKATIEDSMVFSINSVIPPAGATVETPGVDTTTSTNVETTPTVEETAVAVAPVIVEKKAIKSVAVTKPAFPVATLNAYETKGGRKVCATPSHAPSYSNKDKGMRVDEDCCIDPDEVPNGACYYPPPSDKKLNSVMNKAKSNTLKISEKKK